MAAEPGAQFLAINGVEAITFVEPIIQDAPGDGDAEISNHPEASVAALVERRVAAACALAAETPSHAVNSDLVAATHAWIGEHESRRDGADASAKDDHLLWPASGPFAGQARHSTRPALRVMSKFTSNSVSTI